MCAHLQTCCSPYVILQLVNALKISGTKYMKTCNPQFYCNSSQHAFFCSSYKRRLILCLMQIVNTGNQTLDVRDCNLPIPAMNSGLHDDAMILPGKRGLFL